MLDTDEATTLGEAVKRVHYGGAAQRVYVGMITGSLELIARFAGVWTLGIGVRMWDSGALKRTALTSPRMLNDLKYGT